MGGKSPVRVNEDEQQALVALSGSRERAEADRAILLTLSGWTSGRIAEPFGVREDSVRFWRIAFKADLMDAPEFLLPGIAVGDPDLGPVSAQHLFRHGSPSTGGDIVQHRLIGMEHPVPMGDAVHPRRRLVRRDDRGGQQLGLIAEQTVSSDAAIRRKLLAMAPSEIASRTPPGATIGSGPFDSCAMP